MVAPCLIMFLGQAEGFFSGGQIVDVWSSILTGSQCSCQQSLAKCELWQSVLHSSCFEGMDLPIEFMAEFQNSSLRTQDIPLLLFLRSRFRSGQALDDYKDNLRRLYRSIGSVTDSHVVVDSSKLPLYGHILATIPGLDVYFVHLVRDPRGVASSWQRKNLYPGRLRTLPGGVVSRAAIHWDVFNLATELVLRMHSERTLRVSYEELIRNPEITIRRITRFLEFGEQSAVSLLQDGSIKVLATHAVAGNPRRFQQGKTRLREDLRWKDELTQLQKVSVAALTLPLFIRYGYRFTNM